MLLWCQPLQPQLNAAQKHSGSWPREKNRLKHVKLCLLPGPPEENSLRRMLLRMSVGMRRTPGLRSGDARHARAAQCSRK